MKNNFFWKFLIQIFLNWFMKLPNLPKLYLKKFGKCFFYKQIQSSILAGKQICLKKKLQAEKARIDFLDKIHDLDTPMLLLNNHQHLLICYSILFVLMTTVVEYY